MSDHRIHCGASGRRWACGVCRKIDPPIGLGPRADFSQPCCPSVEALDTYEALQRQRIADAEECLAHAAALRVRLLAATTEGALS